MAIAVVILAFIVGVGIVLALAQFASKVPGMLLQRKLDSRLQEVSMSDDRDPGGPGRDRQGRQGRDDACPRSRVRQDRAR